MNHPLMRSGKTHFALLKIEGRKEKRKKKANCERRAGPTHLTCGVRERNIYRPKSLSGFLTLIPFLSLSTSFIIPAVLSCSVCSPSVQHSLSLSLTNVSLVSFSSPSSLSFPPRPPLSPAHECSDGLFPPYLVKLRQNMRFCRQGLCCENGGSSASHRRFTVTQLQTLVRSFTLKQ